MSPRVPTIETTPAVAALVAMLTGLVASAQFAVPASPQYGITTLYLWPIAIAALWFGPRIAMGVVAVVLTLQAVWAVTAPTGISTGGGLVAVGVRGATYIFIAWLVGDFARRLRRTALTDPLTRLPNRRAFFEEVRRRARSASLIGVVTCDVDGLKQINDREGHEAGDAAIIAVSRALRARLGARAFVCRFGGDELVALTTPAVAQELAAESDPVPGARIGVSIHSTVDHGSIDDALAEADHDLYRAKSRLRAAA
jgi:diguanylate cyclase (GGDEF)-like protein